MNRPWYTPTSLVVVLRSLLLRLPVAAKPLVAGLVAGLCLALVGMNLTEVPHLATYLRAGEAASYGACSPAANSGRSAVAVSPELLRKVDPPCAPDDVPFEGECVTSAERGIVYRDPCNPWGARIVRSGFNDFRGRLRAQSPGRGLLERMRGVCDIVAPLVDALAAGVAATTVPYNASEAALSYKTVGVARPMRSLAFGPLVEQGTCAMVADACAMHGIVCDYVLSEHSEGLAKSLGAVRVDATQIQFPDSFFHFISFSHVIEHVASTDKALSELARVLRPEGVVILNAPVMWANATTVEDPACAADAACRLREYKQKDHVRLLGRDIITLFERYFGRVDVLTMSDWYSANKTLAVELFANPEYKTKLNREKMILGMEPRKFA